MDEEVGVRRGEGSDRPDVGGDEDDDGEGAEPCVSDGGDDVARHGGAGEVAERDDDHAQRQGQRYQVEHPHRAARAPSAPPRRRPEEGGRGEDGGGGPEASSYRGARVVRWGPGDRGALLSPGKWRRTAGERRRGRCWWAEQGAFGGVWKCRSEGSTRTHAKIRFIRQIYWTKKNQVWWVI